MQYSYSKGPSGDGIFRSDSDFLRDLSHRTQSFLNRNVVGWTKVIPIAYTRGYNSRLIDRKLEIPGSNPDTGMKSLPVQGPDI